MDMGTKVKLVGTEVPIPGSDSVNWIELTVPSSVSAAAPAAVSSAASARESFAPPTEDRASCSVIGDPIQSYFIWRINKSSPHVLELLEFSADKEFPRNGLQIVFPDALSPFAFICLDKSNHQDGSPYLLYVLTVSGVAYLLQLKSVDTYVLSSSSILPANEITEFDVRLYVSQGVITSVAASMGLFLVGTDSGSVICFKLGSLHRTSPGFHFELRDDTGIGRLWGFVSRGKMVGAVQDLLIAETLGRPLAFVLHSDGTIRVWDLLDCNRVLNHMVNPHSLGGLFKRLWVGQANRSRNIIPLVILHKQNMEDTMETISVYKIQFDFGDKVIFSMNSSVQSIPLEGGCVDVQLSEHNILILKDSGLVSHNMLHTNADVEESQCYALQEEFVADQLYQSSEQFPDDLLWITQSMFSSVKDQTIAFVSSVFLRKLLHPGIFHDGVFQMTMLDYNRHLAYSDLRNMTVDGLKKEILSLIEHEVNQTPLSAFYRWKVFCNRYFDHWCKSNAPLGLLLQPPGDAIVLIRKSSVSLFRSMEKIELLVSGSDEVSDVINFGLSSSDDKFGWEILLEVLGCVNCISQQLGKTASAVIYELLMTTPMISPDDFLPCLLKTLETGYSSSVAAFDSRIDIVLEKELVDHKKIRKFSAHMMLALHNLSSKAAAWGRVLEVIEGYINFLVPQKTIQKFDTERSVDMNTAVLVQSTSQVARVMFESATDILLFLSYLLHIGGQLLIGLVESHARKEYISRSLQDAKGQWCMLHHLLGCSLLAQARGLHGTVKETKVSDAVRCFFRASSGEGASQALQNLSDGTGFPQLGLYNELPAAWKLHYYQWAMQTFEQHNISEGACQFALAALEQVDEALSSNEAPDESATTIRGRLWANVFKFTLDLNHYYDAYCSIISNPDEESKYICLRRFIIVLYERGALKNLCNGQLPFISLTEKVELELSWKVSLNPKMQYKLRLAGIYIYVSTENGIQPHGYLGIAKLDNEYILTSAEYLLCLANIKWSYSDASALPPELVDLLVEMDLYDMAFTVLLKFCKDTGLKRNDLRTQPLLLTSSKNEATQPGLLELGGPMNQVRGNSSWENLELYLGKYKNLHARLPVVVAETLLHADSEIELPLWLVQMFKSGGSERRWGMTGQESNPASLFQLYVDHGRFTEATNLLLEYIDSFKSVRPAEVIFRKRPSSVWFPYTAIERLWCQLERSIALGHMVEQSRKLQSLLSDALSGHLKQLKVDSEDAVSLLTERKDLTVLETQNFHYRL
ncbi:hypothetical protein CRG98_004722 [Punica granatum]|uniref:Uncharacterized protein n=1 Tax=Punica granatum TaxID=22663 RepID=A0A2I0L2W9_PUNGR|nr:hypothetical protein CRG98_004722 [Punica granatum]